MAVICPTVTAGSSHSFKEQMERVSKLSERVHIDLMDGEFTPHTSVSIDQVWWPHAMHADIHLMYKNPGKYIDKLIALKPNLVMVHAEADGNFYDIAGALKVAGIRVGIAMLPRTSVAEIYGAINDIDHVLIFSGALGSFGGHADLHLLQKVHAIKRANKNIEISWDGGVNEQNAAHLISGGVDVLSTGGYIHKADDPANAYARLKDIALGAG